MFPPVYVCVRQWGAWKLHQYNSDVKKSVFYHKVCPFSTIWNMLHTQNFAVMMMLVTRMITRTKLPEASQHHCHLPQCLLSPSFTLVECKNTNPTSAFFEPVRRSWLPEDQWGHKSALPGIWSLKTCLLAPLSFFLAAFSSYYKTKMLHFSMYAAIYDHIRYIYLQVFIHSLLPPLPPLGGNHC